MLFVTMASQLLGCSTAARATELGRMMACAPCSVIRSVNFAVRISPRFPASTGRRYGCLDIMRFFMGSPENISTFPPRSRMSSSDWIRPAPCASSTTMMAASFAVYSDTKRIVKRPYTDVSNLPLFVRGSEWWSPPLNRSNDSHSSMREPVDESKGAFGQLVRPPRSVDEEHHHRVRAHARDEHDPHDGREWTEEEIEVEAGVGLVSTCHEHSGRVCVVMADDQPELATLLGIGPPVGGDVETVVGGEIDRHGGVRLEVRGGDVAVRAHSTSDPPRCATALIAS